MASAEPYSPSTATRLTDAINRFMSNPPLNSRPSSPQTLAARHFIGNDFAAVALLAASPIAPAVLFDARRAGHGFADLGESAPRGQLDSAFPRTCRRLLGGHGSPVMQTKSRNNRGFSGRRSHEHQPIQLNC